MYSFRNRMKESRARLLNKQTAIVNWVLNSWRSNLKLNRTFKQLHFVTGFSFLVWFSGVNVCLDRNACSFIPINHVFLLVRITNLVHIHLFTQFGGSALVSLNMREWREFDFKICGKWTGTSRVSKRERERGR